MQTSISDKYLATEWGEEANSILRKCVHCGFCTATCPTYQILGDELDSPRGRIYLIKQLLEGNEVTVKTQIHLDRCLTCRNCETTCPSGVEYSRLLDIGRQLVDSRLDRPTYQNWFRKLLVTFLTHKSLFNFSLVMGRTFRFLLPAWLQRNLGNRNAIHDWPDRSHRRTMLLLDGCVQPGLAPNINLSAARVLDHLRIELQGIQLTRCCGAVEWHLSETDKAIKRMRANIDAWWPLIERGAEAIVITASACAAMVKEYGYYLRKDEIYAEKAQHISNMAKDISEVLLAEDLQQLVDKNENPYKKHKIAFHPPCTLQHGQDLQGVVEALLTKLGFQLEPFENSHSCCGAAGTYSILQKGLSNQLLGKKLNDISRGSPDMIVTANIGCLLQLQKQSEIEVKHWIELLDP